MGPAPPTSDPNFEPYSKKPIEILRSINQEKINGLHQVKLLSDGRILIHSNDYYIFNKDNPKEIDIKINKSQPFYFIAGEIDYRLLIETSGNLIELNDKTYKFYNGLKDFYPSSALKLSTGLIIITDGRVNGIQFINFFFLDKN